MGKFKIGFEKTAISKLRKVIKPKHGGVFKNRQA